MCLIRTCVVPFVVYFHVLLATWYKYVYSQGLNNRSVSCDNRTMDQLYEIGERSGNWPMDLNTASRHQLNKEYGKHIGRAIYDLQDEGPIYMSSLVEVTDIGADYWLQEARTGVIKPIPEVFVPGMDDLQTRFDNLSMAYADLSNEQLEAERHHSQQLQKMQLEEQRNCYVGLLSDAKRDLTRELDREHTHSTYLQEQLNKQCSRYEDQKKQQKRVECVMANKVDILKERIQQLDLTSSTMSSDMSSGLHLLLVASYSLVMCHLCHQRFQCIV